MTPVRLDPAALRSRVKHSTTEPLRSLSLYLVTVTDLCLFLTMPWVGLQCIIVMFSDPSHLFCFHNLCSTTHFGYLSKDSNATAHKLSIIIYWYS